VLLDLDNENLQMYSSLIYFERSDIRFDNKLLPTDEYRYHHSVDYVTLVCWCSVICARANQA
jgi:hypothetical protein